MNNLQRKCALLCNCIYGSDDFQIIMEKESNQPTNIFHIIQRNLKFTCLTKCNGSCIFINYVFCNKHWNVLFVIILQDVLGFPMCTLRILYRSEIYNNIITISYLYTKTKNPNSEKFHNTQTTNAYLMCPTVPDKLA